MRIASVLPSATEIVAELGALPDLVARSQECDFPEAVRTLPVLMRARIWDADRSSGEVDRRVLSARARGESLYEIDPLVLARVRPDVLLTQDLCGVCSVTGDEVAEACSRVGIHPTIVSLTPRRLEEVWDSVRTVGRAIGRVGEAEELVRRVRPAGSGAKRTEPTAVAVVEWLDPPILAGLWTPDIVRAGGGFPVGPAPGEPGARTSWEAIRAAAPDLVILAPCSYSVPRTAVELGRDRLGERLGRMFGAEKVVVADEAYFSRPGPRLAFGVELVRRLSERPADEGSFPLPVAPLERLALGSAA